MNNVDDFERQVRVVDQMITAHCGLGDRFERISVWQDAATLVLSIVLLATTFLDPVTLTWLGITDTGAKVVLGLTGIIVFASTVLALRFRWKERSGAHRLAAKSLVELKNAARGIDPLLAPQAAAEWLGETGRTLKGVPEIPEALFLKLKAIHVKKVALSKLISERPGAPLTLLRLTLWWQGIFGHRKNRKP